MIGETLHRFRSEARYCLLDFEGESLNLGTARPFQVSYAIATNKEIKSIKTDWIWWSDLNVSKVAAQITRFDYQVYKAKARPAEEVLAEFDAVVYDPGTEVVWMNGLHYDAYAHRNWRRGCGKPADWSYLPRSIDLKALTIAHKLKITPDLTAFLSWQYRLSNVIKKGLKSSLENCAKEEKIDHDLTTLHEAESDIVLTHKVFRNRLVQLDF